MLLQETNPIENIEKSLLSLIINSNDEMLIHYVYDKINVNDFSNNFHKKIYELLCSIGVKHDLKIDKNIILSKIKGAKNQAFFSALADSEHSLQNLKYYIEEIKNNSRIRNLKSILFEANLAIQDGNELDAIKLAADIENKLVEVVSTNKFDFVTPKDLLPGLLEKLKAGKKEIELSSSIESLDKLTHGLPNGYIILAARPNVGKSEFALNIAAHNSIKYKKPGAIFSLEMDEDMVNMRLVSSITEIPLSKLISGEVSPKEIDKIEKSIDLIESLGIHIDTSPGLSATEIFSRAKRLKIKYPNLGYIIIDYMQLVAGNDSDSQDMELTKISRTFQTMRRTLKIPIIVLSQLSRNCELRPDKRPRMSDLRGSGSIEQDSDMVLFLYSDWYYDRTSNPENMEINIGKNRNGPVGTVMVKNIKEIQKFVETN